MTPILAAKNMNPEVSYSKLAAQKGDDQEQRLRPCILIPMTPRELGELDLLFAIWHVYRGFNVEFCRHLDVHITLSAGHTASIENKITRSWEVFSMDQLFNDLKIHFLEISAEEDIYIRHGQAISTDYHIPRLGLKSGPNTQFFRSLELVANYSHAFLHETDLIPFSKHWSRQLHKEIQGSKSAWVIGAQYSGDAVLQADILGHINGSAIYASGSLEFQDFCSTHWEPALESACKIDPDIAYDILWTKLQSWIQSGTIASSTNFLKILAEVSLRFQSTQFIVNKSTEIDGVLSFKDFEYLNNFSDSCIVHNKQSGSNALLYALSSCQNESLSSLQLGRLTTSLRGKQSFRLARSILIRKDSPRCIVNSQRSLVAIHTDSALPHTSILTTEQKLKRIQYTSQLTQITSTTLPKIMRISKQEIIDNLNLLPDSWDGMFANNSEQQQFKLIIGKNGEACWSFLLHEELLQTVVLQERKLSGFLCTKSYKQPVSENKSFIHIFSIYPYPGIRSYTVSANLFVSDEKEFYLMITSGQTHERVFIDLANKNCYVAGEPTRQVAFLVADTFKHLKSKEFNILEEAFPRCNELNVLDSIQSLALMPTANRPFLAVSDYLAAIHRSTLSGKPTFIIDPGFYTFINYRHLQSKRENVVYIRTGNPANSSDSPENKATPSSDLLNQTLLQSGMLLYIPRSISTTHESWAPLKVHANDSVPFAQTIIDNHLPHLNLQHHAKPAYKRSRKLTEALNSEESLFIMLDVACEKRKWVDQEDAYAWLIMELGKYAQNHKRKRVLILLDGMTINDSRINPYQSEMLDTLISIVTRILDKADHSLLPLNLCILPLMPLEFTTKSIFYQKVNYFIAQVGTASLGVSKCFERFGRLIGPPDVLKKPSQAFLSNQASVLTDPALSEVIEEDAGKMWDRQSYHIIDYQSLIKSDLENILGETK